MLAMMHDLVAVVLCWFFAYWLRFNLDLPETHLASAYRVLIFVLCIHAPVYWLFGLYRGIWRYASLMDLRRIVVAALLSAMVVAAAILMFHIPSVPQFRAGIASFAADSGRWVAVDSLIGRGRIGHYMAG